MHKACRVMLAFLRTFCEQALQGKQLRLLEEQSLEIYKFTTVIIDARDEDLQPEQPPRDLLDVLLQALKKPSTKDMLNKVDVGVVIEDLIGGHSVVANLWVWCLYILASHEYVEFLIVRFGSV